MAKSEKKAEMQVTRDLKYVDTAKLFTYLQILSDLIQRVKELGYSGFHAHRYGAIDDKEKSDIFKVINEHGGTLNNALDNVSAEISKRMKKDLFIEHGPAELELLFQQLQNSHPMLKATETEMQNVGMAKKQALADAALKTESEMPGAEAKPKAKTKKAK